MKIIDKSILKGAGVLLILVVMVFSAFIVTGSSVEDTETIESEEYVAVKSIEGTESFFQMFNSRQLGTGIFRLGYYKIYDTLKATVSADGGISWLVPSFTDKISSFSDPPTVGITNPHDGDDVYGTVTITADASDDVGVSKVTFSIDSSEIGYDDSAPYSISWNTSMHGDGWHTITATAYDSEDNTGSDSITVCVGGDCGNNPPYTPSQPSGHSTGEPGVAYTYFASTTDPDDDRVKYGWEWTQDSTVDGWTELYDSGAQCSVQLTFGDPGTYYLKVKAEDEHGLQSGFSPYLVVVISQYLILVMISLMVSTR